jgi:hypothetical protein
MGLNAKQAVFVTDMAYEQPEPLQCGPEEPAIALEIDRPH